MTKSYPTPGLITIGRNPSDNASAWPTNWWKYGECRSPVPTGSGRWSPKCGHPAANGWTLMDRLSVRSFI